MIIAVTDRNKSLRPFMEQFELIASARPDMIILREKDLTENEYLELAKECQIICSKNDVRMCVNTFFKTAKKLGIKDIQLQMDTLRTYSDSFKEYSVGASVHSASEAYEAESLGAERLIFGNVFETACKPGMSAAGLDLLHDVCECTKLPVWAIGGISTDNIDSIMKTGASGVCIMSSIMMANDPAEIISTLRSSIFI